MIIKENIDFKRGIGSKGALNIGGIKLETEFDSIMAKAELEWDDILNSLIGKNVKFEGILKGDANANWGIQHVLVKEVRSNFPEQQVTIVGEDDLWYDVIETKKIYIE